MYHVAITCIYQQVYLNLFNRSVLLLHYGTAKAKEMHSPTHSRPALRHCGQSPV